MPSKIQLIGGAFQDSEGNVLANGYLKVRLSQDTSVSGVGNICSGVEITIQLDASGNVVASPAQYVWGNDSLLPTNTYYRVTGYTAAGQPAWGPNNQQIQGSGTFDLGTWIPNQVISWVPPVSSVLLENNGVPNSSQSVLNLESLDSSVIITDEGGGTLNLAAISSSFDTPGQGFFYGPGFTNPLQIVSDIVTEIAPSDTANRVYGVAFILHEPWTIRKCMWLGFNQAAGKGIGFGIYNLTTLDAILTTYFDSATVLNTPTANTLTPGTLQPGAYSFNWAASNSALIGPTMLIAPPSGGQEPYMFAFYNLGTTGGMAYAANPMIANVMPANLGSLINCTGSESIAVPMPKWTP